MTEIEWADPPPLRGAEWEAIATSLRANPGRWARVRQDAALTTATQIKRGALAAFRPAGAFEARIVADVDNPRRGDVYARFIGGAA